MDSAAMKFSTSMKETFFALKDFEAHVERASIEREDAAELLIHIVQARKTLGEARLLAHCIDYSKTNKALIASLLDELNGPFSFARRGE